VIAIRVAVGSAHHISLSHVTLVESGSLPKTTSGKLQRYLCRQGLVNGTFDALATWSADGYAERVAS
jgi:hypothetical protein